MVEFREEVGDWAEAVGQGLVDARLDPSSEGAAAVERMLARIRLEGEPQALFELLIATARTVGLVLRPAGHEGGPITRPATLERMLRQGSPASSLDAIVFDSARLLGCAASGDIALTSALAGAIASRGGPDAAMALRAMLEVLASEPIVRPPEPPT